MDWGIELWDQFESVDKHHQHGIDFAEKYAKFVKERCYIENEYASKLKKLVKSYHPKKKDEDKSIFSTHKAFQNQLSELNDIANQHELIAEELMRKVNKAILSFCNELKGEKKKIYHDGKHQQAELEQQDKSLEQTKKKFEKEWKECEKAQAYFDKQDNDMHAAKIDVEKARQVLMDKKDAVEACKTDYGAALETFNQHQQQHYTTNMPKLFLAYKEADEHRILKSREFMLEVAKIDKKVQPVIQKCLEEMEKAASAIDPKLDAQLVVDKLKSGFLHPTDKEFEDYTQPQMQRSNTLEASENSQRNSINLTRQANKKLGWLFGNKKHTEAPDYSHLPPEQRKRKLQRLIDDINKDISKEEESKKAILKMQEVYRSNPAMGDADSLTGQLTAADSQIEKMQADLAQLESWYQSACTGSVKVGPDRGQRMSQRRALPEKPDFRKQERPYENNQTNLEHSFGDDFDEDPEPIGTCVALYDFDATSEGALSIKVGEKFSVIEADNGDGWTRAMRGDVDGYVPTSYVEIEFFT